MNSSHPTIRDLDRVEDRIRQQRAVDRRPVLVVEGPSDLMVLRVHLPGVQIFPSDGKVSALRAIRQLVDWKLLDVVAVVDRDFEGPEELTDIGEAVHPYDRRDLEGMLIELGVLSLVLEHQGDPNKLRGEGGGDAIVTVLTKCVEPLSALRQFNTSDALTLSFADMDVAHKTDKASLEIEMLGYCTALLAKSDTSADLQMLMDASKRTLDDEHGARGKDIVSMAGVALRSRIGALPVAATREEILTRQLHSSAGLALSRSEWLRALLDKLLTSSATMSV